MPPGLTLTVTMPGLEPLTVGLTRLRTTISDWRPFWTQQFAPFLYRTWLEEFVLEGSNTGDPWAQLSPAYAQWKRIHGFGNSILVRSGAFKASMTSPDAPDSILRATSDALEIGTNVPYAKYHQFGTRRMPARPAMRVNEPFMRVVGQSLQRYVQAVWQQRRAADIAA